jgi:hypothetical protein
MSLPQAVQGGTALYWHSTMSRVLVHRASVAEVLLTAASPTGPDTIDVAAQWPRGHSVFGCDLRGRHDPMVVLETMRQAGICGAHLLYEVPSDAQFVMANIGYRWQDARAPLSPTAPADITCRVSYEDLRRRRGAVDGFAVAGSFSHRGVVFAEAYGRGRILSGPQFRALRSRRPMGDPAAQPPGEVRHLAPAVVGRRREEDVVIGVDEQGWVRVSPRHPAHPVYYDHPLDHVPGLLLAEAAQQAARLHTGWADRVLVECDVSSAAFTEPDLPASVECVTVGDECVDFVVRQGARVTAQGQVRLSLSARDPHRVPDPR